VVHDNDGCEIGACCAPFVCFVLFFREVPVFFDGKCPEWTLNGSLVARLLAFCEVNSLYEY
jgi:hypothetical protein